MLKTSEIAAAQLEAELAACFDTTPATLSCAPNSLKAFAYKASGEAPVAANLDRAPELLKTFAFRASGTNAQPANVNRLLPDLAM